MRVLRKFRPRMGELAEFGAFAVATAVVWHFAGFWWALIPVSVYLFVLSLALDGGER